MVREREQADIEARREELARAQQPVDVKVILSLKEPPPSDLERQQHEITHLPPARWCEVCLLGRGLEDAHYRETPAQKDATMPVVGVDDFVLKAERGSRSSSGRGVRMGVSDGGWADIAHTCHSNGEQ